MSDINSVKTQIQSLIDLANTTTGNQDTNLTDGVNALVSGFGQGGSGGSASLNIHYGDTEPEDTSMLWCKCDTPSKVLVSSDFVGGNETLNSGISSLPKTLSSMTVGTVGKNIYLFGGYNSGFLTSIYKFDSETNDIEELTLKLPIGAYSIGVGVVGKKIYLFGGEGDSFLNTINVFDTEANTITTLSTTLPNIMAEIGVGVVGKKIYLFGGSAGNGSIFYNTINVFDTETNTITTLSTTLPTKASGIGIGVVGKKIYLFGGRKSNTNGVNTINVFDTETNTITTLSTTLPTNAYYIGVGVIGTKIYLFGGRTGVSGFLNTINVFDTETNTITTLSTKLPTTASAIGVGVVGTKVYLLGGKNSSNLTTIHQYVISLDLEHLKLLIQPSLTENVFNLMNGDITVMNGVKSIYIGNSDNQGEQVEAYLYQNDTWTQI